MFDDIGKKLMLTARLSLVIFPIVSLLLFIVLLVLSVPGSWLCIPIGVLLTLSSYVLFGFGQLVQDVHEIRIGSSTIMQEDDLPRL